MPEARPLTPMIGAEISSINLSEPIARQDVEWLNQQLVEHKVLFFRNQPLSTEQHLDFARLFGELETHPVTPKQNYPEVMVLHNDADRPPQSTAFWHSDVTWRTEPSLGSVLLARVVPKVGGDTLFANMEAAYEGLDPATRKLIDGRRAIHAFNPMRKMLIASGAGADKIAQHDEEFPPVTHPIVRTHPVSGRKSIYVNTLFTIGIEAMPNDEAKPLLRKLFATATRPEYQCRFQWQQNSIAFWDNRAAQHYAVADYFPAERLMERVTIAGEKPQ